MAEVRRIGKYYISAREDATGWGGCKVWVAWPLDFKRNPIVFSFCMPPGENPYLSYAKMSRSKAPPKRKPGLTPGNILESGKIELPLGVTEEEVMEKIRELLETKFKRYFEELYY